MFHMDIETGECQVNVMQERRTICRESEKRQLIYVDIFYFLNNILLTGCEELLNGSGYVLKEI